MWMRSFVLLLFFLTLPLQAFALSVKDMRVGAHPDKTRLVFDLSAVADFQVFTLGNPYRVVIDLPSVHWAAGQQAAHDAAGITAVRYGAQRPGVSRIVLDMAYPVQVRSAFVLPAASGKAPRLVVDYSRVSAAQYQEASHQVFGTLENDSVSSVAEQASRPSPAPVPRPVSKAQAAYKKPVVIVDPGHGGEDPGAIGAGNIYEKNIVLALGKALKAELEATGRYKVYMTRSTDHYIKLSDRVKFARKHNADLFISIHADSIDKAHVRGASVYTLSEKASDKQTARLAARENRSDIIAGIDLSHEDEDVASILVDLAMRDTMNQSKFFAERIVDSYKEDQLKMLDNAHRHAGFAVLKAPDIPSVLVEAGFMSNRNEVRRLSTPAERRKVAKTLRTGIDRYFEQVRKNQGI